MRALVIAMVRVMVPVAMTMIAMAVVPMMIVMVVAGAVVVPAVIGATRPVVRGGVVGTTSSSVPVSGAVVRV